MSTQKKDINIQGTYDYPLFQANQIGKLLGFKNIHKTLANFDEDEKVITSRYTPGGNQDMTFITDLGLYRLCWNVTRTHSIHCHRYHYKTTMTVYHKASPPCCTFVHFRP